MNQKCSLSLKTAAILAIVTGLVACNKDPAEPTAGQKLDAAVASTEQHASAAAADAQAGMAELKQDMKEAGDKISTAAEDASITAGVNAELAKDSQLSALKIDVDTSNGQVVLTGKAPDAESRERATRLASNVKGVTHVDNKLEIGG